MRRAEARFSASIISSSCIRCCVHRIAGRLDDEDIRAAHVLQDLDVDFAVGELREIGLPERHAEEVANLSSRASDWPCREKILNLSSWRARSGLRSRLRSSLRVLASRMSPSSCATVWRVASHRQRAGFAAASICFASLWHWFVPRIDSRGLADRPCCFSLLLKPDPSSGPRLDILAGRLGFEPRQSAPKALDLPLVDRPVMRCAALHSDDAHICQLRKSVDDLA